jgi:hypothetical protein
MAIKTRAELIAANTATFGNGKDLRGNDERDFNRDQLDSTAMIAQVISANQTAVNDQSYTVVATATFTDPSPVEGKGFTVFVRNGTATVGGIAYPIAGTVIKRIFHSGSWANYAYTTEGSPLQISMTKAEYEAYYTDAEMQPGLRIRITDAIDVGIWADPNEIDAIVTVNSAGTGVEEVAELPEINAFGLTASMIPSGNYRPLIFSCGNVFSTADANYYSGTFDGSVFIAGTQLKFYDSNSHLVTLFVTEDAGGLAVNNVAQVTGGPNVTYGNYDLATGAFTPNINYKEYIALLTQSGTDAPTANVIKNTFGDEIVWTRNGAGQYKGTLVGAFPVDKYFGPMPVGGLDSEASAGGGGEPYSYTRIDDDVVVVNAGSFDGVLLNTPVSFLVKN